MIRMFYGIRPTSSSSTFTSAVHDICWNMFNRHENSPPLLQYDFKYILAPTQKENKGSFFYLLILSYNVWHLRRDPALDSSYLRPGHVLSEFTSMISLPTTKGRMPHSSDALLYAVGAILRYLHNLIHLLSIQSRDRKSYSYLCRLK
jgi:hypothetical protein